MTPAFDPKALLSHSYTLERGQRVRLRLPAKRDEAAIRALLEHAGVGDHELNAARLVRTDPRGRLVLCATGLIGKAETLLGVGEISLSGAGAGAGEPTLVVVDERLTDGLAELLSGALVGRATAISRSRAA